MNQAPANFPMTEEAFLLSSLKQVVNIWARGTGEASFDLVIKDGVANLKLGFQLGHPSDPHLPHEQHPSPHTQHPAGPKQRRRKGPARREKDRARAAAYQARLLSRTTAATSCHKDQDHSEAAAASPIILPFKGKILPVKSSASAAPHSAVMTPSGSSLSAASTAAPVKAGQSSAVTIFNLNVNSVKKHLFVADEDSRPPPPATDDQAPNYQKKEARLWSKLFSK